MWINCLQFLIYFRRGKWKWCKNDDVPKSKFQWSHSTEQSHGIQLNFIARHRCSCWWNCCELWAYAMVSLVRVQCYLWTWPQNKNQNNKGEKSSKLHFLPGIYKHSTVYTVKPQLIICVGRPENKRWIQENNQCR